MKTTPPTKGLHKYQMNDFHRRQTILLPFLLSDNFFKAYQHGVDSMKFPGKLSLRYK